MIIITPVRNKAHYDRYLVNNPHVAGCDLVMLDNTVENRSITQRYNRFLDAYAFSTPAWFIFCHEDFEPKESLKDALAHADPASLYGTIGVAMRMIAGLWPRKVFLGETLWSPVMKGKKVPFGTPCDTVDCCCLIVHSSLIQQTRLRFDEALTFDLYAEDFCIQAAAQKIPTRILPLKSLHHSGGAIGERYRKQHAYLNEKYAGSCHTATSCAYIGTPGLRLRLATRLRSLISGDPRTRRHEA